MSVLLNVSVCRQLANMFVLQAVMYPDLPFGVETLRKGFYRAFFTLFISFVAEFD